MDVPTSIVNDVLDQLVELRRRRSKASEELFNNEPGHDRLILNAMIADAINTLEMVYLVANLPPEMPTSGFQSFARKKDDGEFGPKASGR